MKISAMPLEEVLNQLQILEYIETNTTEGLTEGDRSFRAKLQEREKHLRETVSAGKQHPLRDKLESAALRLDHFLDAVPGDKIRRFEATLLAAAREIAQAIEMVSTGA
jgi:hypothetical protein